MAIEMKTPVPTQYVAKVLAMLDLFGGQQIYVQIGSVRKRLSSSFIFKEQQVGESDLEFGERFQKEFWLNGLEITEKDIANKRIAIDEADIDRSVAELPNDIIT